MKTPHQWGFHVSASGMCRDLQCCRVASWEDGATSRRVGMALDSIYLGGNETWKASAPLILCRFLRDKSSVVSFLCVVNGSSQLSREELCPSDPVSISQSCIPSSCSESPSFPCVLQVSELELPQDLFFFIT